MKAVFVVGTGRSGTHFTVRLLNGFENSHDPLGGKENPKILKDVARAAIHHRFPSSATSDYYRDRLRISDRIFIDQHHPNLFFVRHWAAMFDGLVFLYPKRPTHQIVASMLRHNGVMNWYRYADHWRQRWFDRVPFPNRFLGLARADEISTLPVHLLCAHRVIAHHQAYKAALAEGGADLRCVDYEALVDDPLAEFSRVFRESELRELGRFTLAEIPNRSSLAKYLEVLDDKKVAQINALEHELGATAPGPARV